MNPVKEGRIAAFVTLKACSPWFLFLTRTRSCAFGAWWLQKWASRRASSISPMPIYIGQVKVRDSVPTKTKTTEASSR